LGVRVARIMTDNGPAYRSKKFAKLLRRLKIKHLRTRPYTPRTNGKAERFIQTLLREWAYAYTYPNSEARARELPFWITHYNFHRPHSATANLPPASRLGFGRNNVVRNYT
jgi:transposase InsO family protein